MLTQGDINEIENVVKDSIEEKTKNLPTKDEFFTEMDKVVGELQKLREEVVLTTQHYEDTNQRIDEIDKHLAFNSNLN